MRAMQGRHRRPCRDPYRPCLCPCQLLRRLRLGQQEEAGPGPPEHLLLVLLQEAARLEEEVLPEQRRESCDDVYTVVYPGPSNALCILMVCLAKPKQGTRTQASTSQDCEEVWADKQDDA